MPWPPRSARRSRSSRSARCWRWRCGSRPRPSSRSSSPSSRLSGFMQAALTSGVQLGFVAGCLVSAFLGARRPPRSAPPVRRVRAASARPRTRSCSSSIPASAWMPALRFVTGVAMAGVYPVGMKLASTWAKGDMGLMVGILVGALTLGSASPHLFNAFGGVDWRVPVAVASLSALAAAALLIGLAGVGPNLAPRAALRSARGARRVARRAAAPREPGLPRPHVGALRDVGVDRRLPARRASRSRCPRTSRADAARSSPRSRPSASGAIGCVGAGCWPTGSAARRSRSSRWPISGSCAAGVGVAVRRAARGRSWPSASSGASASSRTRRSSRRRSPSCADRSRVGTMLTLQTALGFTLTLATIHLMPPLVEALGWRYAFVPLAIGPAVGVLGDGAPARPPALRRARRRPALAANDPADRVVKRASARLRELRMDRCRAAA